MFWCDWTVMYKEKSVSTPVYKKINSKCVIDLNIKAKTVKHLKENVRENLSVHRWCEDFLNWTQKAQNIFLVNWISSDQSSKPEVNKLCPVSQIHPALLFL